MAGFMKFVAVRESLHLLRRIPNFLETTQTILYPTYTSPYICHLGNFLASAGNKSALQID